MIISIPPRCYLVPTKPTCVSVSYADSISAIIILRMRIPLHSILAVNLGAFRALGQQGQRDSSFCYTL